MLNGCAVLFIAAVAGLLSIAYGQQGSIPNAIKGDQGEEAPRRGTGITPGNAVGTTPGNGPGGIPNNNPGTVQSSPTSTPNNIAPSGVAGNGNQTFPPSSNAGGYRTGNPPNSSGDVGPRLIRSEPVTASERSVETRLAVLESAKADVQIWIAILIAVVVLLLAANVGLSVWQVGSIARKEVDENLSEFDMKFSGVVDKNIGTITQAISVYESRIEALSKSVQEANARTDDKVAAIQKATQELNTAGAEVRSTVIQEAERLKAAALHELKEHHEALMLDLAQKQARK
jgi:hypothetical protein